MSIPFWALRHQGPTIGAILKIVFGGKATEVGAPGPVLSGQVAPRPEALIRAFKSWSNDDSPDGVIPDHYFAQWAFPLLGQALGGAPYPMSKILNQGFSMKRNAPLPADQPLLLQAQLLDIEEVPGKAKISTRITTGFEGQPDALHCEVFSVVPLPKTRGPKSDKAPRQERDESDWRSIETFKAGRFEGAKYCCLSGDINPLHWFPPFAWAAGMKAPILHGFAAGSLICASLDRHESECGGRLRTLDMRFIRPMVLPTTLTLQLASNENGQALRLIDGRGKPCAVGSFSL